MKKAKALWLLLTSKYYFLTIQTPDNQTCTSATCGKLEEFTQEQLSLIRSKRKGFPGNTRPFADLLKIFTPKPSTDKVDALGEALRKGFQFPYPDCNCENCTAEREKQKPK